MAVWNTIGRFKTKKQAYEYRNQYSVAHPGFNYRIIEKDSVFIVQSASDTELRAASPFGKMFRD